MPPWRRPATCQPDPGGPSSDAPRTDPARARLEHAGARARRRRRDRAAGRRSRRPGGAPAVAGRDRRARGPRGGRPRPPHRDPLRRRPGQGHRPGGRQRHRHQREARRDRRRRDDPLLLRRHERGRAARGPERARDAGRRSRSASTSRTATATAWSPSCSGPGCSSGSRRRSGSSSTSPRASRARTATSGSGPRSRRSSPGRSATAGRSGSTCPRRSTSTSRAARSRSRSTDSGTQVFRAETSNPLSWFAWVNARNDSGLTREQLDLAGGEVVLVRAWPEDSRWRRRVGRILRDGIPELTRRIGLPWPVDGSLSVLEIHTPLLEGYAGFYDPENDEITISEDLDDATIVHEASHAWFNQQLFTERWITEGLAETYAMEVVDAIGEDAPGRPAVDPEASVAFPLNDWPGPSPIKDDEASAREQFGYDAAYQVMTADRRERRRRGDAARVRRGRRRHDGLPGRGDPGEGGAHRERLAPLPGPHRAAGWRDGRRDPPPDLGPDRGRGRAAPRTHRCPRGVRGPGIGRRRLGGAGRRAARDGRLAVRCGRGGDRGRDGRRRAARPGRGAGRRAGPRAADRRRGRVRGGGRRQRDPGRRGRGGVGGGVAPDAGECRDDRGGAAGLADRARAVGQDARRRSRAGAGLVGGRPL